MSPTNVLVTGANRGIGLEFVKQLLQLKPNRLIATCRSRSKATELIELENKESALKVITLDITDENSVTKAKKTTDDILTTDGLNVLINNAAIYLTCSSIRDINLEEMIQSYRSNVVGPALMCREFLPLLERASENKSSEPVSWERAAIVNISSDSGSVKENNDVGHYNYGPTKAALNMLTKTTSLELRPLGILVAAIHPGWVLTDMTGPEAEITTEESVTKMLELLPTLREQHSGKLFEYTGREMPW